MDRLKGAVNMKSFASKSYKRVSNIVLASMLVVGVLVTAISPVISSINAYAAPATVYSASSFDSRSWTTDRTAPSGNYSISGDNLTLNVDNTNASATPGFYRTEGISTTLPAGNNSIKANLFLDPAWATIPVRAGMWGVSYSSTSNDNGWPIIEYASNIFDGVDNYTGFRVYDTNTGDWYELPGVTATLGSTYNLEVAINANTHNYEFYVNGSLVKSYETQGYDALTNVIFNDFNSATTAAQNYSVSWDSLTIGKRLSVADTNIAYVSTAGDDNNDGASPESAFKTVQRGINAVTNGGKVIVAAGSYDAGANITKSITLQGAGVGVDASGRTHGSVSESLIAGVNNYSPTFAVNADNVTIDGFDFGPSADNATAGPVGVDLGSTSGAVVKNSIFEHNQRGVSLNGASNVTITGDLISYNNADPENNAGIWGDNVDTINISNNELEGASNTAINLATGSKHITINADIFKNDGNTAVIWQDNDVTFSNNYGRGFDGSGLFITGSSNVNVTNNDLSLGTGFNGISVSTASGTPSSLVTITGNTIDGFNNAINLGDATAISDVLNVHNNKLGDNASAGVNAPAAASILVDATSNWWGTGLGPKDTNATDGSTPATNNTGTGTAVNGAVNYSPWYINGNLTELSNHFPVVQITHPIDGALLNGTVDVTGTITDGDPSVAYLIATNNTTHAATTLINDNTGLTNISENWNTTLVADGTYTIHFEAKDLVGNDVGQDITVTVDNTAPAVPALLTPVDGVYRKTADTNSSSWSAVTDPHGPVTYYYESAFDSAFTHIAYGPQGQTATSILNPGEPEGTYYWRVMACDSLGNCSAWSTPRSINIDNSLPSAPTGAEWANHTGDILGLLTNVNVVTPEWTAPTTGSAVDHYDYEYTSPTDSNWSAPEPFTGTSIPDQAFGGAGNNGIEGPWDFRVRTVNRFGDVSDWTTAAPIIYDKTAPNGLANVSPVSGIHTTTANQQVITWTAGSDLNGPLTYYYESSNSNTTNLDGSFASPVYQSGALTTNQIPTANTPAGVYFWHVRAVDAAGNSTSWTDAWSITVDNTAPVVTVNTFSQNANVIQPNVTATDDSTPLTYAWTTTVADNDVTVSDAAIAEPTFTVHNDGTYSFDLTVTDAAGNSTVKTFAFTYTTPVVTPTVTPETTTPVTPVATTPPFTNVTTNNGTTGTTTPVTDNGQGVLGDSTTTPSSTPTDDSGTPAVLGTSTDKGSTPWSLAWYWWILIIAGLAAILWAIIAAIHRRRAE